MVSRGRIVRAEIKQSVKDKVLSESDGCAYCFDVKVPLQVDHFVPLSRGGTNEAENLRAVCVSCNSQKRAMLFHEWRLYRQTHGMPWPPLASYATDPVHYGDVCRECRDLYFDLKMEEVFGWGVSFACDAEELRHTPRKDGNRYGGYKAYYRCPAGHHWTCWYAYADWYYSDCPCTWCQVHRDDYGDATYTRVRYSDEDSPIRKIMISLVTGE